MGLFLNRAKVENLAPYVNAQTEAHDDIVNHGPPPRFPPAAGRRSRLRLRPWQGLKEIAVMEAAQRHWTRARDPGSFF
jgi:hypothetical protein